MTALPAGYGADEAARRLTAAGYPRTAHWLKTHLSQVPHTRIGRDVRFTDAQLLEFLQLSSREPVVKAAGNGPRPVSSSRRAS